MNIQSNNAPSKPLAISYARFSTVEQAEGDSLRRQTAKAREYCAKAGYQLIEDRSYFDSGVSAYKGKNKTEGQLGNLLQDAEAGIFPKGTRLIVESFDRLGRDSLIKQFHFFAELLQAGLVIVTFDGGRAKEYSVESGSDLMTVMSVVFAMSRAYEESRFKSERVSEAWSAKRLRASTVPMTKIAPYWLKLEEGKFQVIEERAAIVRRIFALSRKGLGRRAIAARLNSEKVPVWGSERRNPMGIWRDSYVSKILSNTAVLGQYQPHRKIDGKRVPEGEVIENYFPAIIEEGEFFAVNHRARRRIGKGGRGVDKASNLFSGISSCYCCGGPLHYVFKGQNWRYLRCEKKSLCKNDCAAQPLNYSVVERTVLRNLGEINWRFVLQESARVLEFDQTAALNGELATVAKKIENLLNVATDGLMEAPQFKERFQALEAKRTELVKRLKLAKEGNADRTLDRELSIEAAEDLRISQSSNLSADQRLRLKSSIAHLVRQVVAKKDEAGNTLVLVKLASGGSILAKVDKSGDHQAVVECDLPLAEVDDETIESAFGREEIEKFRELVEKIAA